MLCCAFHALQAAFSRFMMSSAKGVALGSVWLLPVMYFTHSYSPAYPSEMVEYPPYSSLSIGSPFFSRAQAPYCHRIGAASDSVPFSRSWRHSSARWHSSMRSSKMRQNLSMLPPELRAMSGRFTVTTP